MRKPVRTLHRRLLLNTVIPSDCKESRNLYAEAVFAIGEADSSTSFDYAQDRLAPALRVRHSFGMTYHGKPGSNTSG